MHCFSSRLLIFVFMFCFIDCDCTEMSVLYCADDHLLLQSTHFQGLVASGSTEIAFCSSGAQQLYPDDNDGDGFGTDQSQEQSVVFVLFLYREITPIYTKLQSIDRRNWSLESSIHPASSLSVNR